MWSRCWLFLRWFLIHTVLHHVRIVITDTEHVALGSLTLPDAPYRVAHHILANNIGRLAGVLSLVLRLWIVNGKLEHTARFAHREELLSGRILQIDTVPQPLDRWHWIAAHDHLQNQIVRLDVVMLLDIAHEAWGNVLLLRDREHGHLAGRFDLSGGVASDAFVRAGIVQLGRDNVHCPDTQLRIVLHVFAPHQRDVVLEPLDRRLWSDDRAHQLDMRTLGHRLVLKVGLKVQLLLHLEHLRFGDGLLRNRTGNATL
uniref:Putative secreted protein n=1 Tax=Anopheles darlingi TaxID=43151 RepID=A0A2M4DHK1_ANODA